MNYAVIKTGGKQYVITDGQKLRVEKLAAKEGERVVFSDVLLMAMDKDIAVGVPAVKGATVEGKVLRQLKSKKVTGVKMKAKKRRKKYFGHRQQQTEVEITKISA